MAAPLNEITPPNASPFLWKKEYDLLLDKKKVLEFRVMCSRNKYSIIAVKKLEEKYWNYFGNENLKNIETHPPAINCIIKGHVKLSYKTTEKIVPIYVGRRILPVYISPFDETDWIFNGVKLKCDVGIMKKLLSATENRLAGIAKRKETMKKRIAEKMAERKLQERLSDEDTDDELIILVNEQKQRYLNNNPKKDGDNGSTGKTNTSANSSSTNSLLPKDPKNTNTTLNSNYNKEKNGQADDHLKNKDSNERIDNLSNLSSSSSFTIGLIDTPNNKIASVKPFTDTPDNQSNNPKIIGAKYKGANRAKPYDFPTYTDSNLFSQSKRCADYSSGEDNDLQTPRKSSKTTDTTHLLYDLNLDSPLITRDTVKKD